MEKKVDIIKDADVKNIVVINDLRFKGRPAPQPLITPHDFLQKSQT